MIKLIHGGGYKKNSLKGWLTLAFGIIALSSTVFFSTVLAESNSTDLQVTITPVISIRVAKDYNDGNGLVDINALDLNVTPTNTGAFVKDNLSVLVSTSNPTGYTLTMANNDDDTSMHNTNTTITTTIPSITADADESTFSLNSWAYSLGDITDPDQTFNPIPTSTNSSTIKTIDSPIVEDQTDVTFAAKIDNTIEAGTYYDTIVFTATTNYVPPAPFGGITKMQEMTPAICAAEPTPDVSATDVPEVTLTDTRDGKTYVVRKLADGNCWMVQNLDLDLSTSVALTSENTNLVTKSSWTPQNNTQTTAGTAWAQNGGDVARSMDPGDIYFPDGVGTGTADANGNLQGATSGEPWEFIGNYYNWYAATAGTGTAAMASGNATDSICPKGWKLPDNSGPSSFQNLVTTTYGITDDATGATKLLQSPLNFVRSGRYNWAYGIVYEKGTVGYWQSATANSATYAHYLSTDNARVVSQNAAQKGNGFTIRCVAEQENLTTISTMQQMTPDICAATPTPAASATVVPENTLTDARDGNTYVVRKLADSNCWMSQNLRLGKVGEDINLTPADSDVSTDTTIPASQIQNANGVNWNQNDTYHIYDNSASANYTSYGNYYNWYTATAGTGTAAMVNQDAPSSICPKGWKLPSNTGTDSYQNLVNVYGATTFAKIQVAPLNFVPVGVYDVSHNQSLNVGGWGFYWSASATASTTQAYYLFFRSNEVFPQNSSYGRIHGFSVRCVAR